jgi:hypothetical protein
MNFLNDIENCQYKYFFFKTENPLLRGFSVLKNHKNISTHENLETHSNAYVILQLQEHLQNNIPQYHGIALHQTVFAYQVP